MTEEYIYVAVDETGDLGISQSFSMVPYGFLGRRRDKRASERSVP